MLINSLNEVLRRFSRLPATDVTPPHLSSRWSSMAAVSESNIDRALLFRRKRADARAAGLCSGEPGVCGEAGKRRRRGWSERGDIGHLGLLLQWRLWLRWMALWRGLVELISFCVVWPASWCRPGLPAAEIWSMKGTPGLPDVSGWNLRQHHSTCISDEGSVLWEGALWKQLPFVRRRAVSAAGETWNVNKSCNCNELEQKTQY